jgi:hypothetical protein
MAESDPKKYGAAAPAGEQPKLNKTLIIELNEEVGDITVKSNFKSVFEAVAMLERAKHFIQKSEDDEAATAAAQAKIIEDLRNGVIPMPGRPGARRTN